MELIALTALLTFGTLITVLNVLVYIELKGHRRDQSKLETQILTRFVENRTRVEDIQDDLNRLVHESSPSIGGENNWDNIRSAFSAEKVK